MNTDTIEALDSLYEYLQGTADWREDVVADRYPEDERNKKAAKLLWQMADELPNYKGTDLHKRLERAANAVDTYYMVEMFTDEVRRVGFSGGYNTVDLLLESLCIELEGLAARAA